MLSDECWGWSPELKIARPADGATPIYLACLNNNLSIVKMLARAGAPFEPPGCPGMASNGWLPLHIAAHSGHFAIVQYLVKVGVAGRGIGSGCQVVTCTAPLTLSLLVLCPVLPPLGPRCRRRISRSCWKHSDSSRRRRRAHLLHSCTCPARRRCQHRLLSATTTVAARHWYVKRGMSGRELNRRHEC